MDLFRSEADGQIALLTEGLLALEGEASPSALEALMRAAHSLKGAARIVGRGPFRRARSRGPVRRDGVRVCRGRMLVLHAWPLPLFNTQDRPAGRSRPADGAVAARCG